MASFRRMDDKEFRKRLSEVADWIIPKNNQETTITGKKKRGRKSNDEKYMELREQIFQEEFDGVNNTIAPVVTRVKRCPVTCEDCGAYCPNGREKEAKLHEKNDKKVWRQKCVTCGKFENPFNGKYELTGSAASIKFNDFMRETKGVYKTQGNERRQIAVERNKTIIQSDTGTITIYQDSAEEK